MTKKRTLFDRIFKRASAKGTAYLSDPDAWLQQLIYGRPVSSGVRVTNDAAMRLTAVYACVRVLSESIASLPLVLYRRLEKGKEKATDHPVYRVLHDKPNGEQSPFQFKEMMQAHLCRNGNAYAYKEYNNAGQIESLWPLLPTQMQDVRRANGQLVYEYRLPNEDVRTWTRREVFHIAGLGFDGVKGLDPIEYCKEAIGLGLGLEEYGASFFGNNSRPDGYIAVPDKLTDREAHKRMKESWEEAHQGLSHAHKLAILEQGAEYKTIGIAPEHAQFLETRRFQKEEIATMFRVPLHMINSMEKNTTWGSGIESINIGFVTYSLVPWFIRWQEAISTQIISDVERSQYFSEFVVNALMRGDAKTRAEFYRTMREIGVLSANDVRELESMNPVPDGDIYHIPMNWVELGAQPELPQVGSPIIEDNSDKKKVETRAMRSGKARHRIANSYYYVLHDGIDRFVKKENANIRDAVKKYLNERDARQFAEWVSDYYKGLSDYIKTRIMPSYMGLATAIRGELAGEIDVSGALTSQDEVFLSDYADAFVSRYIGHSRGRVLHAVQNAAAESMREDEAVIAELDTWGNRAHREAMMEATRASNAVAKFVYVSAGVSFLRWQALGAETCPFCQAMDGKVVSTNDVFQLEEGLMTEGKQKMTFYSNIGHPPLHEGCVCQIGAG